MPYLADDISKVQGCVESLNGKRWYCKKPEIVSLLDRLNDAWLVLKGEAIAVIFKI